MELDIILQQTTESTSVPNTVFLTVFSGVLVYVLSQLIQNFVLKPLQEF
ncbi:MAG: hypothetical protein R3B92_02925 [Patescibacteria group bacterium]